MHNKKNSTLIKANFIKTANSLEDLIGGILRIDSRFKIRGNKLQSPILLNGDFLAFFLYLRKYANIGSNLLLKTFTWGLKIMEIPDEMLREIRESGYDQELVYTYIREILDNDKEYDV